MYLENNRIWDVEEIFQEDIIDVIKTLRNIINRIDSGVTYYYKDHIKDKPNVDNCNTALYETIALKEKIAAFSANQRGFPPGSLEAIYHKLQR